MDKELGTSLWVLRIGLGVFLLLFGLDKLVAADAAARIFMQYYGMNLSTTLVYGVGVLEIALALAILAGAWRTLSYGLGFLVHAASTLASYRELLAPFGDNHMHLSALPVLAAFAALFLLRHRDSLWSLDARRTTRPRRGGSLPE